MNGRKWMATAVVGLALTSAACERDAVADATAEQSSRGEAAAPSPEASGEVIEVKMITDEAGNYFEPVEIEAERGDVVRFVLESGVHNVSFPSGENAGLSDLPAPSAYLQLPGQTFDLTVDLGPGEYVFQCDPHAALGMVGSLTVRS